MMRTTTRIAASLLALTACLSGCRQIGPRALRTARRDYNIAIQKTNNEQLLLNLVRLRYRDTPYFLQVASISTSFALVTDVSGSAVFPKASPDTVGFGVGMAFTEKPTITYTPLDGEKFVKQVMTPMDMRILLLLYHSGWSVERIFLLVLQGANGLPNAPSASGPTPDGVPVYKEFREAAGLFRALQTRSQLALGQMPPPPGAKDGEAGVEIYITPAGLASAEGRRLCELLSLDPAKGRYPLVTEAGQGGRDRIAVVPRSLVATMFYVSQAVEAPARDERAGRVTVTRDKQGKRFDWNEVTGGLIRIHSSLLPPKDPYLAVHYRGHWFHIDDSDLTGKSTFSLLVQLFALQAGGVKTTGPILTLPVTGS